MCRRCDAKATVTLGEAEHLCRPCAVNVVKDRAFMEAWNRTSDFQKAYDTAYQAVADCRELK